MEEARALAGVPGLIYNMFSLDVRRLKWALVGSRR